MDNYKILIAEDESRMRKLIKDFLVRDGYYVVEAGDGAEALSIFKESSDISLVILDVMMPNLNGIDVCQEIRTISSVPIIMLTAKDSESDELDSFDSGADEFISKPFSPKILMARIAALLRRSYGEEESVTTTNAGGIIINLEAHTVTIEGKSVDLSYKEFELLSFFIENEGIALSREKILNNVWNYDYYGDARTIDTHVKKLRQKLGEKGSYIKTIWGIGYKFEPAVE
ncbi:MAG: response regulator transcription factor [Clostridiales bacterium]|nr:response regulator transcription factor [Clostridiales bacterium]MBS5877699.1 response regulator transcription factor [Clostridiales bacterium]MDU0939608.1 response regulator transcription factor [Clostridiales bacterium]MDU1042531.1 response regulator transcription factor [Clostridiales bacterium]MDU3490724.1 response regulator transcription factor [Clostridiales bacterium]